MCVVTQRVVASCSLNSPSVVVGRTTRISSNVVELTLRCVARILTLVGGVIATLSSVIARRTSQSNDSPSKQFAPAA